MNEPSGVSLATEGSGFLDWSESGFETGPRAGLNVNASPVCVSEPWWQMLLRFFICYIISIFVS